MTDKQIWISFAILIVIAGLVLSQHSVIKHGFEWKNAAIGETGKD